MSADAGLQFVDTNILVYAYDHSTGEKHELASALVKQLWEQKAGCLSIQVLQEFYVNATRKVAAPLEPDLAAQIIADLCSWRLHIPDGPDVLAAIEIQKRYQLSFWDAMIIRSAAEAGCVVIWSEDFSHGQVYEGVRAANPLVQEDRRN